MFKGCQCQMWMPLFISLNYPNLNLLSSLCCASRPNPLLQLTQNDGIYDNYLMNKLFPFFLDEIMPCVP
jgi:hypothetical protein